MDVVRHQAIRVDLEAEPRRLLAENIQVEGVVVVEEEHILAVVAPLRDVMRAVGQHGSSDSGHSGILLAREREVNQK